MSELSVDIKIPRRVSGDSKPKLHDSGQSVQGFRWLASITWATALLLSLVAILLFCLIPVRVRITSVKDNTGAPVGYFTHEQWVLISGTISDLHADHAFLDLNGDLRPIPVKTGEFQSQVPLVRGINRVVVSPTAKVLPLLGQSETVRLFSVVPPSDIWSELTWDGIADLDLHLVEPSLDECYYGHDTTAQGAHLDLDNREGYGPEHITVFSAIPGTYKLYVNYYKGHGTMHWRVNLRLRNGPVQTYSGILEKKDDQQTAAKFTF